MAHVLCIGDIHAPATHPAYLSFCKDMYLKWKCDTVVFIGDIVDHQAISFHAAHPECPGPADEYALASEQIAKWYAAFPTAYVCIGNHDERVIRLAQSVNIPSKFLRDYKEIWRTPKWTWDYEHCIDDVCYYHGTGTGGIHPAFNAIRQRLISVTIGHHHSAAGIKWLVNPYQRIFAMDVGSGVDVRAFQFAYGRHFAKKPVLSCGVVIDGIPYHEMMPAGDGEQYDRVRFGKKPPVVTPVAVKTKKKSVGKSRTKLLRDKTGKFRPLTVSELIAKKSRQWRKAFSS